MGLWLRMARLSKILEVQVDSLLTDLRYFIVVDQGIDEPLGPGLFQGLLRVAFIDLLVRGVVLLGYALHPMLESIQGHSLEVDVAHIDVGTSDQVGGVVIQLDIFFLLPVSLEAMITL